MEHEQKQILIKTLILCTILTAFFLVLQYVTITKVNDLKSELYQLQSNNQNLTQKIVELQSIQSKYENTKFYLNFMEQTGNLCNKEFCMGNVVYEGATGIIVGFVGDEVIVLSSNGEYKQVPQSSVKHKR